MHYNAYSCSSSVAVQTIGALEDELRTRAVPSAAFERNLTVREACFGAPSCFEVPSCAACHRDHQGSAAEIVRPTDANCLGCHRGIDAHRNGASGLNPQVANISGFGPAPAK